MFKLPFSRRALLSGGAAISVAACTGPLLRASGQASSFDWTRASPESAGMTASGLQGLRAAVQQSIETQQITGAVTAFARKGRLAWFEAQGTRDPATGAPMREDDLFRMMSSTKPVTAVAVLMMMDEGKLSIDDKVSRFIPGFTDNRVAVKTPAAKEAQQVRLVPAQRDITIKDLLTHTSGLTSSSLPSSVWRDGAAVAAESLSNIEHKPGDTLASYVPRLSAAVLDFQPGSRWSYSPLDGFDVLLRIVEIVSGVPADVLMRERLFEPLDMRSTWFHVPERERERVLPLYAREGGTWVRKTPMLDALLPPNYISGAGGLYGSAHDFLNFELMLLNKGALNGRRVLRASTVELMSHNHVGSLFAEALPPLTDGHGFGLGVRVVLDGQKVRGRGVGAFGWGGAYGTETWADPELELAGVMLVQQPSQMLTAAVQSAVRRAIAA